MSFPGIIRRLFANNGAGPLLRGDILPLNYGTCSTAAGTAAKVVSIPGFALATGAEVTVRFTVTNTASSPTLNINGTGAKPIQYRNAAIAAGYLAANRTYRFVYDGSSYELVGDVDTNTTYTAATAAPKAPASSAAVGTSAKYAREDHVHPVQESVTGSSGSCSGNSASASKLSTKRTIGGVQFDGSANIHHFGTCSTAAGTAAKTVALSGFVLATGAEITVKFSATNTASSPTLNVNNTGAKGIRYLGAAVAAGYLAAGRIYRLLYDGSYWNIVGDIYIHAGSVSEEQEALRLSMIGVPRYWRSTTLPAHHCWANGDFVEFADWPELKKVYDAGGFKGMLMAWDADEETQAANLGMWRPDAAKPTGLFTPNLSGQFFRNWAPGSEKGAGTWGRDEIRNITGTFGIDYAGIKGVSGAFSYTGAQSSTTNNNGSNRQDSVRFSAASVVPTGQENVPPHVWQPLVIYLGRSAQV
ncbi:hypothetical protein [Desulfovibrio sp. SGI.133]|uniref:hypothetical protein n=1 Tax=Desulfovibrio sp. SGI.133 TaxID=3420560 RepID=UPI003D03230E